MLSMVEREARYALLGGLPKKSAEATRTQQVDLLQQYKDRVHTITNDNGHEFAEHEKTSEQLKATVYFAHPYASWERGSVENMNGLVRQYFPKEQKLKEVDPERIEKVQAIDHRPGTWQPVPHFRAHPRPKFTTPIITHPNNVGDFRNHPLPEQSYVSDISCIDPEDSHCSTYHLRHELV